MTTRHHHWIAASVRVGRGNVGHLLDLLDPESWMASGLCAQTDPDAFYPEKGESSRPAKRVCLACPVRAECLRYALAHDEQHGVWAGTSPRERRQLREAS